MCREVGDFEGIMCDPGKIVFVLDGQYGLCICKITGGGG